MNCIHWNIIQEKGLVQKVKGNWFCRVYEFKSILLLFFCNFQETFPFRAKNQRHREERRVLEVQKWACPHQGYKALVRRESDMKSHRRSQTFERGLTSGVHCKTGLPDRQDRPCAFIGQEALITTAEAISFLRELKSRNRALKRKNSDLLVGEKLFPEQYTVIH